MSKKLFLVKVVLYVMAEDEVEACLAATVAKFDIFECASGKAKTLLSGWENAIPYNADDERTCSEIFATRRTFQRKQYSLSPNLLNTVRIRETSAVSGLPTR